MLRVSYLKTVLFEDKKLILEINYICICKPNMFRFGPVCRSILVSGYNNTVEKLWLDSLNRLWAVRKCKFS